MIKRLVKLTFQADKTDEFIHIFEKSKDKIRAMSGCQHVELLRDATTPHIFFTLSLWDTEGSLDAYRQSDFFRTTWAKTKALFSDKPSAWTTEMISTSI
jgi:heme oxygenase (mycobilin-producing)